MHSHRHLPDIFVEAAEPGSLPRIVQGQRFRSYDVGKQITAEERAVLENDTHLPSQGTEIETFQVLAVVIDSARRWCFDPSSSRNNVDFPQPDWPTNATNWPACT